MPSMHTGLPCALSDQDSLGNTWRCGMCYLHNVNMTCGSGIIICCTAVNVEPMQYVAGAIQRFSVGFRGPLCLVCGFTGVPPVRFALGAALGALGTMPLQLTVVTCLSLPVCLCLHCFVCVLLLTVMYAP